MKKNLPVFLSITLILMLASCVPKLTGTWKVNRYEVTEPGGQPVSQSNIGTLTLKKNGEGEKNLNYLLSGKNKTDNSMLGWHSTGPYIGIESPGSEFSKTWVIITNKKREQKWRTTEGGKTQILELSK